MNQKTEQKYREIIYSCKEIFRTKTKDYGSSWRILRVSSITDQIFIKARRIRSIQEKGHQKINDGIDNEFRGIINYCIMALIQQELPPHFKIKIEYEELEKQYDKIVTSTLKLLKNKNHDYDEAWKEMRVSSMTDIILMKLMRVKQIENNLGKTIISEGVDGCYQDIINYAIFCLILLSENFKEQP